MSRNLMDRRFRVAAAVVMAAVCFVVNVGVKAYSLDEKKKENRKKEETFTRPKPTRPIKPEIPGANRYRQDKIFLEYADSLYKISTFDTIERQILKGNVKFRQAGMWMYCDSAYYYPELNSLDAFGNVKMEQGDTLFVFADKLYYEGNIRMARLKNGPSRNKVELINRDVTLTTDSLDYDLGLDLGWYEKWGTIDDKVNTLTSLYGEYSPGTKNADFYHDVVLVNNEDGFTMLTDTLHYNTDTHIARIESRTEIQGESDTIITTRGLYDTQLGNAELLTRSVIIHRDSTGNVTTLEGDSIIYDKQKRISRAYMFRDPLKHGMPMVLTDTAHKTTIIGGYGVYNDSTREALSTIYPLLMEYSQNDTLFLRADTIKTYIITELVNAGRRWTLSGYPERNGEPIIKADSLALWIDKAFFSVVAPLIELPMRLLRSAAPAQMVNESSPLKPRQDEYVAPNSVPDASEFVSVSVSADSVAVSTDSVSDASDSIPKVAKDFHVALAYHRARFFKSDIQGVADSIVFVERDSMMYMFRKPIVWSGERQVTGNRIDVHFNDSTADWALLPESGMMSEYVGEDFYNQLAGKTLFAKFKDQTLHSLEVSGNVETVFLPQESDSTYNRMVNAESSFLTIEMEGDQMKKLKMWPEVSGTVTPLFLVKKSQQYLQKFHWWTSLRPVREWYGDRLHWADNLGEVSDELEQYFLSPSDFGEPKSFSGTRFVAPVSSIPLSEIEENEVEMQKEAESVENEGEEIEKNVEEESEGDETSHLESGETTISDSDDDAIPGEPEYFQESGIISEEEGESKHE